MYYRDKTKDEHWLDNEVQVDMTTFLCSHCKIVLREDIHHCNICNTCVNGWHYHSDIFGTCIGDAVLKYKILLIFYLGIIYFTFGYALWEVHEHYIDEDDDGKMKSKSLYSRIIPSIFIMIFGLYVVYGALNEFKEAIFPVAVTDR